MKHPKYKTRFERLCKDLGITQYELAQKLGISHNHRYCCSRGKRALGVNPLEKLHAMEQSAGTKVK